MMFWSKTRFHTTASRKTAGATRVCRGAGVGAMLMERHGYHHARDTVIRGLGNGTPLSQAVGGAPVGKAVKISSRQTQVGSRALLPDRKTVT